MLYKSIALELLRQRPEIHDRLRKSRTLLPTLNRLATELRTSHSAGKDRLSQTMPGSSESQIASEALARQNAQGIAAFGTWRVKGASPAWFGPQDADCGDQSLGPRPEGFSVRSAR